MLRYNPEHDEPDAKLESGTWQDQMHMLCYSIIKQDSKAMTLNIFNTEYIFLLIFIYNYKNLMMAFSYIANQKPALL